MNDLKDFSGLITTLNKLSTGNYFNYIKNIDTKFPNTLLTLIYYKNKNKNKGEKMYIITTSSIVKLYTKGKHVDCL